MQTTILLSPVFNSNSQRVVKLPKRLQDFHEKRTAVIWILFYIPTSFLELLHSYKRLICWKIAVGPISNNQWKWWWIILFKFSLFLQFYYAYSGKNRLSIQLEGWFKIMRIIGVDVLGLAYSLLTVNNFGYFAKCVKVCLMQPIWFW